MGKENKKDSKRKTFSFIKSLFQNFNKRESLRDELIHFFNTTADISLQNDQIQMIVSITKLMNVVVSKIKVPYSQVFSLPDDISLKEAIEAASKSGFSRIPVYRDAKNGNRVFKGLLYVKGLLATSVTKNHQEVISKTSKGKILKYNSSKLLSYIRPIEMVPESQSVLSLLRQMRLDKAHLMLTIGAYGEVTGLITLEDILEEIVGDIRDEFDFQEDSIKEIGHRKFFVNAQVPLSEINNKLAVNLPEEKFNTLSGFLLHELDGDISTNEEVIHGNVHIRLHQHKGNKIISTIIQILP